MDELGKMLNSPVFWIGTVMVGVLINLGTQWAYGRLARLSSRFAQVLTEKRRIEFERDVAFVLTSPEALALHIAGEVRQRWYAASFLLFAVFFLLSSLLLRASGTYEPAELSLLVRFVAALAAACILMTSHSVMQASKKRSVLAAYEGSIRLSNSASAAR
jgi:hypothetical protein